MYEEFKEEGERDYYNLYYDHAHITGWNFRDEVKAFGLHIKFTVETSEPNCDPIEQYLHSLETFLESRRIG